MIKELDPALIKVTNPVHIIHSLGVEGWWCQSPPVHRDHITVIEIQQFCGRENKPTMEERLYRKEEEWVWKNLNKFYSEGITSI